MTSPPDLSLRLRDEVARLGFELVDVRIGGPPHRRSVRLRIDRPGSRPGAGVTSDDCALVSRALQAWFTSAEPRETVETMEVSSPGIERPIRWPEHWRRFVGSRVRVRVAGLAGRPVATIQDVPDDQHVILDLERLGPRTLALDDIREATLVVDWPPGR
ncbi:MAG TPA: ribosome maturation factor RimP [Gemmatimonadales bacterium]